MTPTLGSEVAAAPRRRLRIQVEGIVQGVGFRPYLYHLAQHLGLAGHARNDTRGVLVEVEGAAAAVAEFQARLEAGAPPLALIERVTTEELAPAGESGFTIRESDGTGSATALVSADIATCADCLRELLDPADRRYRYPFINCTHCGPRFTIINGLPYDRSSTTMANFIMCVSCRAEYEDPADRRFHAQPNACAACGPRVWLAAGREQSLGSSRGAGFDTELDRSGRGASRAAISAFGARDPIAATVAALRGGAIVAIKGIGGFHLACLAASASAVRTLRARKRRAAKPFALMVPDLGTARRLVYLDAAEEQLLCSRERPIVLARRRGRGARGGEAGRVLGEVRASSELSAVSEKLRPGYPDDRTEAIASDVAPAQRDLGIMLPYTPLHHLLLAELGEALVLTSGNLSDEPIAFHDDDALARLAGIADLFLLHDRPIRLGVDDSVARVVTIAGERRPQLLRRARGYAPVPLALPVAAARPVLACGGQLKNTFCLVRHDRAWLSHHIGDLEEYETLRAFGDNVVHLERLSGIRPGLIAHDLHPEYLSTKYARDRVQLPTPAPDLLPTQHHHAHLAACLAEHGEHGPALGVIFDGTGYGPDGTIWGGEFLLGGLASYERVGHLLPVRMPGGAAAIREPWRMAAAWLVDALADDSDGAEIGHDTARPEPPTGARSRPLAAKSPTLDQAGDPRRASSPPLPATLAGQVDPGRWAAVARLARTGFASPLTTSMGRLFDAVSALCGLCAHASYEGEAAIALEGAIDPEEAGEYPFPLVEPDAAPPPTKPAARFWEHQGIGSGEPGAASPPPGPARQVRGSAPDYALASDASPPPLTAPPPTPPQPLILDPRPLIRAVVADLASGAPAGMIAARFHNTLARAVAEACGILAERHGVQIVVLTGGVFQNRELLERSAAQLAHVGLRVLTAERVPPNDGGIAYGQAAIVAVRSHSASPEDALFVDAGATNLRADGP